MARRRWSDQERRSLRRDYPDTDTKHLAERYDCTVRSVYSQAVKMGLKKSKVYRASPAACALVRDGNLGEPYRFKHGHRPHNAGQIGFSPGGRSCETQFKAGHRPNNWRPIGSERITKDGYRQRKMTDTGYPPRDWVGVHKIVWTEHHGPIPDGHLVIFVNGDRRDLRIENLKMVTRSENMHRNNINKLPPALQELCRAKGRLQRAINARMNDNEKQN